MIRDATIILAAIAVILIVTKAREPSVAVKVSAGIEAAAKRLIEEHTNP